ncbi:E3 ubiquitin-protein ligase TRIM39-like [Brachionichthys hirsutus]|uniref:E3 ubiquitin-protein ligase TRIM39-like n=1 Tax=Brachionichthys hirsutus TaxID=412623 RepID=UPI00360508E2
MAAVGCVLSEEQLQCPICLDLLTQPVSTPCGHNFCRDCIEGYWRSAHLSRCPVCKQMFNRLPELRVNILISEVTSQFKKALEKADEDAVRTVDRYGGKEGVVSRDLNVAKRGKGLKSCLGCLASFCKTHLDPHHVQDTFKKRHLIDPTVDMLSRVCKKHDKPLDRFCHTDETCVCQICIKKGHKAHDTVPIGDESRVRRAQIGRLTAEAEESITSRLQKIHEINQIVELSKENMEKEAEESLKVFNKLLLLVQRGHAEAAEAIGVKQKQVESKAGGFIVELQQEIEDLRQSHAELERLSQTDDDFYLLRSFPTRSRLPATRDWFDARAVGTAHVGEVRSAVRETAWKIEVSATAETRTLSKTELQRARQYAADVTLDSDTAHPKLVLSEDKKQVFHGDLAQSLPDNPQRFYPGLSVLGKEGFCSGRFYFEVQVRGKTEWDIGVGLESVNRKGGNTVNPENGYWALGMRKNRSLWALSSTPVCVVPVEEPQIVGVYVDVDWGQVAFYSVGTAAHIYSFTGCTFNERLFPYFNPRRNHCGLNLAPLIILPVTV